MTDGLYFPVSSQPAPPLRLAPDCRSSPTARPTSRSSPNASGRSSPTGASLLSPYAPFAGPILMPTSFAARSAAPRARPLPRQLDPSRPAASPRSASTPTRSPAAASSPPIRPARTRPEHAHAAVSPTRRARPCRSTGLLKSTPPLLPPLTSGLSLPNTARFRPSPLSRPTCASPPHSSLASSLALALALTYTSCLGHLARPALNPSHLHAPSPSRPPALTYTSCRPFPQRRRCA